MIKANHSLSADPMYSQGYSSGFSTGRLKASKKLVEREKILVKALNEIAIGDDNGDCEIAENALEKWIIAGGKD